MFLGLPTIAWAFLAVSLIGAVFTANAFVPVRRVPALFMPSFFGSWLTAELAIHHVVWQSIAALVCLAYAKDRGRSSYELETTPPPAVESADIADPSLGELP